MKPTMYCAGFLGFMGGFFIACENSFARLAGYKENDLEVKKYSTVQAKE